MILLTTSRQPTRRIRTFCHDLERALPRTVMLNRGKLSLRGLVQHAVERGLDRVIVIDRWKGGPGKVRFYKLRQRELSLVPPQIHIKGVKLQREFEGRERSIRSLVMYKSPAESSSDIVRLLSALSDFLNVPIIDVNVAKSKYETAMHAYRDQDQLTHLSFFLLPKMVEVGPHLTISHLAWENR